MECYVRARPVLKLNIEENKMEMNSTDMQPTLWCRRWIISMETKWFHVLISAVLKKKDK